MNYQSCVLLGEPDDIPIKIVTFRELTKNSVIIVAVKLGISTYNSDVPPAESY